MKNMYSDGAPASRGDVVLAEDGGRYVVIDPAHGIGFILLVHIENPTNFTMKARIERCQKQEPGEIERQHAAEALARIGVAMKRLKRHRPHGRSAKVRGK